VAQIVLTTMHEELEKVAQSMDAKVNPHAPLTPFMYLAL
jgi:hypothetical protein